MVDLLGGFEAGGGRFDGSAEATDEIGFPTGTQAGVIDVDGIGWHEGKGFAGAVAASSSASAEGGEECPAGDAALGSGFLNAFGGDGEVAVLAFRKGDELVEGGIVELPPPGLDVGG